MENGKKIKSYKDVRIKKVENGFAVCYDVEYHLKMMPGASSFDHVPDSRRYEHGKKEVFENKGETMANTLDRALARVKEMVMMSDTDDY